MVSLALRRYPLAQVNYGRQEIGAVVAALESGQTTCGSRVEEFEQQFARYVGRKHAVMVNSGSSADLLAAFGLGPGEPGDEILVPAVTWPTQVWSCLMAGYRVRLVDVDPLTLQFDMHDLMTKINGHTRAVFPVHVLGAVGDMEGLCDLASLYGLSVLEDCCEALGARYNGKHVGTFGQAAAFSFFFSHVLTTGEGGMVVCDDPEDDHRYRLWRAHGWEPKQEYRFWFPTWGLNVRPTEIQGAFGNVQMGKLDGFLKARAHNALQLRRFIESEQIRPVVVSPGCDPAWHGYPLMVAEHASFTRDQLCRYLEEHDIETRPIIAGNLARQPAVQRDERIISGPLLGADAVHERGLYIGLASFDDPEGTAYVAQVIRDFEQCYR